MFSTYSIPTNHPIQHLPRSTKLLVLAFARPQLPFILRQHIGRVHRDGTKLAEWFVQIICNDLATKPVLHYPILCGYRHLSPRPRVKTVPSFVSREWTTNSTVVICNTIVGGKKKTSDIVVTWLLSRFVLPRIWDTVIRAIEDENTRGYFGVLRHCHMFELKGDTVLQIQIEQ
jgi:hypothetical protein